MDAAKKTVSRTLHFWNDGFSIEDGPLYRFDDPANGPILRLIRSGRAPLEIMDVEADQPVDVTVSPHDENYVQPKKKYKPFSSGGQRLGSPTPGVGSTGDATQNIATTVGGSTRAPSAAAFQLRCRGGEGQCTLADTCLIR